MEPENPTYPTMIPNENQDINNLGIANEICTQAIPLTLNDDCVAANNQNARFTGDLVDLIVPFDSHTSSNETGIIYTRPNQGSTYSMSTTVAQYDVFNIIVD